MLDKLKERKGLLAILALVAFVILLIVSFIQRSQQQADEERVREEAAAAAESAYYGDVEEGEEAIVPDEMLARMQDSLISRYGSLPDGYIWDINGELLSIGDKDLSAEEVVYNYLNGIRTLDMSMVQKYSRDSSVVATYEGYFDASNPTSDYYDSFLRNMYRQAMLSFKINGIVNSSIFADNREVFTVEVEMLDLTNKDFWLQDKYEIYKNLDIYSSAQSDSASAEMYLYDYILDYYTSPLATTRTVTFDLTLEKYADLDSGWLVSVDRDINDACRYADGNIVVNYINEMFRDEGMDMLNTMEEHGYNLNNPPQGLLNDVNSGMNLRTVEDRIEEGYYDGDVTSEESVESSSESEEENDVE